LDGEGEVIEKDARTILDAKCLDGNHVRGEGAYHGAMVNGGTGKAAVELQMSAYIAEEIRCTAELGGSIFLRPCLKARPPSRSVIW
jgi:hypothetical protein